MLKHVAERGSKIKKTTSICLSRINNFDVQLTGTVQVKYEALDSQIYVIYQLW